ncbi:MAG TPA: DUF503 domain-containing protein [Thermoanaerobaculia bacterium]|nr:DUF503 domain-containing protein [Thermoanaerobaculia bacterium]
MQVAVAVFELHIPHAQSLKDKRGVVRSLRDRLRQRYELSVAEVGLQDLHQRSRIGVAAVASDGASIEPMFEQIAELMERESEAMLIGWHLETIQFGEDLPLDGMKFD